MKGAGKATGSIYRGGPGMFTWMLHRVTGILIFFFLFAHILDTAMVAIGDGRIYDGVIGVYHHPVIKLMEIGLVVAVIFHAMNGIKVTLVDFWSKGTQYIRQMSMAFVGLAVILSLGATVTMFKQLIDEMSHKSAAPAVTSHVDGQIASQSDNRTDSR